jgi:isoleucyl-tRNA synthetase
MDVWFDSGSSWNGVLRERGLKYPADLYLEGNDQYRGWFNASLILSVATMGVAPFENCVTHGWVMDENWQKMSKSAGNGIDPTKVANQYGADILRLWAATVNFETDVRISESIIATVSDQYRKIRNTFKFMLGNLQDGEKAYVQPETAPKLFPVDTWILAEEEALKNQALKDYDAFHYANVAMNLTNFLVELSGFYLDIAKDALYCEEAASSRRKAFQYVIYKLTKDLCLLYNPILSFTMDEVYSYIPGHTKLSPQLEDMPKESHDYEGKLPEFAAFKSLRDNVLKALEEKRAEGVIGASSEADASLEVPDAKLVELLKGMGEEESATLFGVSCLEVKAGEALKIDIQKAKGELCARCRNYKKDVTLVEGTPLCGRCRKVLGK